MTAPLLALCGVDYAYPNGVMALRGLNLTVAKGQKLAILGANGSGKTTLLLHLNGTLQPTRGAIRLDGQPVRYDHRALTDWRRRVGLVLQEPEDQLFAATVGQDVSFGPLNLGLSEAEAREQVNEALTALEIADLADRATHTLSFGQKKRVAIAGILAMRPELLALDEPTAELDGETARKLSALIVERARAGAIVVMTTHLADELAPDARAVLRVEGGKVAPSVARAPESVA